MGPLKERRAHDTLPAKKFKIQNLKFVIIKECNWFWNRTRKARNAQLVMTRVSSQKVSSSFEFATRLVQTIVVTFFVLYLEAFFQNLLVLHIHSAESHAHNLHSLIRRRCLVEGHEVDTGLAPWRVKVN